MSKECNNCTKCCEGWLAGNIGGLPMHPGKPCFFVDINKGCKVYSGRPKNPCKDFLCAWIVIEEMPEQFKPDNSGVLAVKKKNNGNPYIAIYKAPNNPTDEYISWITDYTLKNNYGLLWYFDDQVKWIGNSEFDSQMIEQHSPNGKRWKWTNQDINSELLKITSRPIDFDKN